MALLVFPRCGVGWKLHAYVSSKHGRRRIALAEVDYPSASSGNGSPVGGENDRSTSARTPQSADTYPQLTNCFRNADRERCEPGADRRQPVHRGFRHWQRIPQFVAGDRRRNGPNHAETLLICELRDQIPSPQRPYLAVDDVNGAKALREPVRPRPARVVKGSAPVAHQDCVKALHRLQAKVVVDPSIGEPKSLWWRRHRHPGPMGHQWLADPELHR